MNRLPTKQIYLLSVIIVGIIALSVYSTYALFTFEGSTADIVTIHTPNSLKISENIYEYQQINLKPNSVTQTDIDIYNSFDYEVCYSAWYKVVGDNDIQNKVQIFEKTDGNLSTSGTLSASTHLRVTIVITNDNDSEVKVNIGTIGASKEAESCSLNLSSDKQVIVSAYKNTDILINKILESKDTTTEIESNYFIYENISEPITFKQNDNIYISTEFTYNDEIFTLTDAQNITLEEFINKYNLGIDNTYFCILEDKCEILYKINEIKIEESEENEDEKTIIITNYNKYIGYSKGTNGLKNINKKDYIYYGDNPNNFIYYNCTTDDVKTCELWRIIGFFYNEESNEYNTKIVRHNSIGKYQFDYKTTNNENQSSNNWNDSTLNKFLNEEYKLSNTYDIYTDKYIQFVERIIDLKTDINNMKITDEKIESKVSMLSLSDFIHTSSCQNNKIEQYQKECLTNNWLNNKEILKEWTLTSKVIEEIPVINDNSEISETEPTDENTLTEPTTDETNDNTIISDEQLEIEEPETNNYVINYVYSIGNDIGENDVNESLDVRPVVFLKSRMLLVNGDGTFTNPYIVR